MTVEDSSRGGSKPLIGLYPGTFDPLTLGHLDIVKRAVKLVDHLVIGVATNASKSPLFSLDERIAMMRYEVEKLPPGRATVEVLPVSDILLVEFARSIGANMIIRGLRAVSDFESDIRMEQMNQRRTRDIETVVLMADPRMQAIASKLVKAIAVLGGDVKPFTSPYVAEQLVKRSKERS